MRPHPKTQTFITLFKYSSFPRCPYEAPRPSSSNTMCSATGQSTHCKHALSKIKQKTNKKEVRNYADVVRLASLRTRREHYACAEPHFSRSETSAHAPSHRPRRDVINMRWGVEIKISNRWQYTSRREPQLFHRHLRHRIPGPPRFPFFSLPWSPSAAGSGSVFNGCRPAIPYAIGRCWNPPHCSPFRRIENVFSNRRVISYHGL